MSETVHYGSGPAYEGAVMVRDASSGNGPRLGPMADDAGADLTNRSSRGTPSSLTQELAQLLAASIAQNQANRASGSGMPTNAELTSLASLVSAASAQRTLAPVFKDGLSALSYNKPLRHHGRDTLEAELPADDEPMPIPSTWREPVGNDDQRWYRQQMGAAFLGLVAGLMIVVPSVLWLSGWIGAPKSNVTSERSISASERPVPAGEGIGEIRTVKVQLRPMDKPSESAAQYVASRMDLRAPTSREPPEQASLANTETAARMAEARRVEELLAQAARRVTNGDVVGARDLLAAAEEGAPGPVTFALAETYDPNMLAAWGTRGAISDVERAKALYRRALDLGISRAHVRLEALK